VESRDKRRATGAALACLASAARTYSARSILIALAGGIRIKRESRTDIVTTWRISIKAWTQRRLVAGCRRQLARFLYSAYDKQ